jgi:aminoglycoside phosphotransferase (APT) family kinase protein
MSGGDRELADRLAAVMGADVYNVVRLSGGASRETWSFDAAASAGTAQHLILQRQRPGSDRDMGLEARVLRAAAAAGVPVAKVVAASASGDELGAPYMILTFVEGETIARRILRDPAYADARPRLAAQLGRAAASIHGIDPATIPGLVTVDPMQLYRQVLDASGQPHPAFELAFRWLDANRPDPVGPTVIHGDLRLGNVIVGADGLRAVIDWEISHLGDPVEDLGWLCVRAWRFGGPGHVAGVGSVEDLLDAYEEASGVRIDPDVLRWWETLGSLKWGIMCIMQASAHLTGVARSHELAAIGRRVCENEHDVLLLLP